MAIESSGALTGFYLSTSESSVDNEFIGVLDFDLEGELGKGKWHIYIEGTSTSKAGKITSIYGESLADAGGAADSDGDGRIQISNIEYYLPVGSGELVMGILYPSGFTESGDWSNDETTQFVSSAFVNIQTSGAPDYALGIGYMADINEQLSYSLLLSQAQGLGDLDAKYSTLFDEVDDYFMSAEWVWKNDAISFHTSIWGTTLDSSTINGDSEQNYGVNLSLGYENSFGFWLLRYGTANDSVSEISDFIGVSYQKNLEHWAMGFGYSQSMVSSDLKSAEGADDTSQFEAYVKYHVVENFHLTASLQKINNSNLGLLEAVENDPNIFTLRASYEF